MANVEKTVFISYRRADVFIALMVYERLTKAGYDVFFDYKSISSGDFEQKIISSIKARAHFLLILTPTALDRCNRPRDWLRREIEMAIDEKRNIIPLFFKGFSFNSWKVAIRLRGKLSSLQRYNGLSVPEDFFDAAMDRLCSSQYLDVPLDAVLHPITPDVQKLVQEQQEAANEAINRKNKTTEASDSRRVKLKLYSTVLGILLAGSLGFLGVYMWADGPGATKTPSPGPLSHPFTPPAEKTPPPMKDGMTLVFIPGSSFTMGTEGSSENEAPAEIVYVKYFWIDQTEVTNAMYAKCEADDACAPPHSIESVSRANYYTDSLYANYPVIEVSWYDAKAYCEWAGRRLPTEAEWEKAARGLDQRIYPWGNVIDRSYANYNGAVGDTTMVGLYEKGASPYGVLDMAGNISEWVSSLYKVYPYTSTDGREDLEASGSRVVRGGSWYGQGLGGNYVRSTYRSWFSPTVATNYTGFRCAMDAFE